MSWTPGAQVRLLHSFRDFKPSKRFCRKSWFLCALQTMKLLRAPSQLWRCNTGEGAQRHNLSKGPKLTHENSTNLQLFETVQLVHFFSSWEQGNINNLACSRANLSQCHLQGALESTDKKAVEWMSCSQSLVTCLITQDAIHLLTHCRITQHFVEFYPAYPIITPAKTAIVYNTLHTFT